MSAKLEELKKRHVELQQQITDESKAWFTEESKAIFDKYPDVKEFSWTQYTPYFADGDECVFSLHGDPSINGRDKYEDNEANDEYGVKTQSLEPAYADIQKLIDSIDCATMKVMFGDHVMVKCKRDGIETEEYHHD